MFRFFTDRQSDEYVREAVEQCRDYFAYTHYGAWNFSEGKKSEVVQDPAPSFGGEINYEVFIDSLQKIHYDGYLVSEYCLPVLKNHSVAGIEEVDRANRLALKYMKRIAERSLTKNIEKARTTLV